MMEQKATRLCHDESAAVEGMCMRNQNTMHMHTDKAG